LVHFGATQLHKLYELRPVLGAFYTSRPWKQIESILHVELPQTARGVMWSCYIEP